MAVTERKLSLSGGKIDTRVLVAGDGDPVLFLHGTGGLAWDPYLDGLAASHQVFAAEHPGAMQPEVLEQLRGIWDLALYYDELLDALELETTAVIGHSFGGMVAAELAANSPRRVGKLVLIAPFGLWRDENPIPDIAATPAGEMPKLLLADPDGPLAAGLVPPADDPQALFEHAQRMASILHFIWPLPDKGLKRRLHRIRADTLLVWGREDRLVSPAYAADFAALLGKSQTALIDGAGHLPQLEATDAVRDRTLAFLRS